MGPVIEIELSGALERRHSVRAFHRAGWLVTAPWASTDGVVRVIGPTGEQRELETFGLVSVDVGAAGDVVVLEEDPDAGEDAAMRIRVVHQDGSSSSITAHVVPTLRFEFDCGGEVAFGPPGALWVSGCDTSKEEGVWVGLIDSSSGHLMAAAVVLPEPYPGQMWLHRGPSPTAIVAHLGAGQHGQWHYLVEFVGGALVWRQLGSADETTPASFFPSGVEFAAAEDWSAPRLIIGRADEDGIIESIALPSECQPIGVFAVSDDLIVVAEVDSQLKLFDRRPLRLRSPIQLPHELSGPTLFHQGRFVSEVLIDTRRHWITWRLAGT